LNKLKKTKSLALLLCLAIFASACAVPAGTAPDQPAGEAAPYVESDPMPAGPEPPVQEAAPYAETDQEIFPAPETAAPAGPEDEQEVPEAAPLYNIAPRPSLEIISNVAADPLAAFDLSISQAFHVTRPAARDNHRVTTQLAAYFVTGTSNPGQPLYFNGQEVERLGTRGTWGVLVQLNMGDNTFTARQGDVTTTMVITRRGVPGVGPINNIVQNSMFPATQGGVRAGGMLPVEATAPSGSRVVASFGGQSVVLQQVAAANPGIPATFRGQIPVGSDYPAGVTTRVGKVSYQLTHNGVTTNFQSSGDVFVAGQGSHIAIRVTAYLGIITPTAAPPGPIRDLLMTGATDFVHSETNTHFGLFSGGFISKAHAEIIEGQVSIGNGLTGVTTFNNQRWELYNFSGNSRAAHSTRLQDGVFYFTLFNTAGSPQISAQNSRLFSSVTTTVNDNNSVTYAFTISNQSLWWGYQVWYDGNDTVLRFQYRPRVSGNAAQPLSGVIIMLDPGHGGSDPGAMGIAAGFGPDENTLNMANSVVLRNELQALGAQVLMTRTRLDQTVSLDERLHMFATSEADMFISVHHNALLESTNANTVHGAEVFFHTPMAQTLSTRILDGLVTATGRNRRQVNQGLFRVTLLSRAPSMLLEVGFMSHPVEYERLTDPNVIRQNARGIAQGIVSALS